MQKKKFNTRPQPIDLKKQAKKGLDFFKNLLFALIAALLIKTFLIETSRVPTGSMESTIKVGDFLFVNKFIYGSTSPRNIPFTDVRLPYFQLPAFAEPERNEIVVFEYPGDRDELKPERVDNYVKRCVGTPGDTLEIIDKVLFVNGKEFFRPPNIQYLKQFPIPDGIPDRRIFPAGSGWNADNYGPLVIPSKGDTLFLTPEVAKAYRTIIDREFGERVVTIEGDDVLIKGEKADYYVLKENYFFMMGDNRDDSSDSRMWGLVPRSKVVGRALMIYWSWNPNIPFSDFFKLLASVRLDRIAKLVY